ncbi:MAG: hypothetical protein Aurels2KO_07800 [Aureliella sp.]
MARKRKRINWPYRWALMALAALFVLYVGAQIGTAAQSFAKRSAGVDWPLAIMAALLDATIAVWFVSFGACIGSFLNVVAYRLPIGRGIGGNSSCPYCRTPIDSLDNVPVLGWIKLRARCRACRLPISSQYPLVELAVAIVFLVVYVTEFASGSYNLPVDHFGTSRSGFLRLVVTPTSITRVCVYLFAVSGLIGAALIAVRNQRVPLKLFAWSVVPLIIAALVDPETLPISWKDSDQLTGEPRLHALVTLICGATCGLAIGRCVAPILHKGFDPSLLASDANTRKARQFLASMTVLGMVFGWQASLAAITTTAVVAIAGAVAFRRFESCYLDDFTVWAWLGAVLYRTQWFNTTRFGLVSTSMPSVAWCIAAMISFVGICFAFRFTVWSTRVDRRDALSSSAGSDGLDTEEEDGETEISSIAKSPGS